MRTMDVVPYDDNWNILYEQEKAILQNTLGDIIVRIEHFGSTSVPGLAAKPIIDIMILVNDIGVVDKYNEKMSAAGYGVRGEHGIQGRRYFVRFKPDNSGNHSHHIHIYRQDRQSAKDELMFRDYLRINPEARQLYNDLKLTLSKQYYTDPLGYMEGKTELVRKLTEDARVYIDSFNMNSDKIISHFGSEFYSRMIYKLARYSKKWELYDFEQIDYYSVNCIFKCRSKMHGDCVLKIGEPCKETKTEYETLVEYNGNWFCRVYEADIDNGVFLIERIIPGTQLRVVSDISERLDIFCEVYKGLHKPPTDISKYPSYLGRVSRIAAFMREKKEFPELSGNMTAAEQICRELCEKYTGKMLLHGDLHHDNILLGNDEKYHIIDPKGVVGDIAFDIPRFILNEFENEITDIFIEKYRFIVDTLSRKLSIPKKDILKLVYVEMCMANSWCVEDDEAPNMADVAFTKMMMNEGE